MTFKDWIQLIWQTCLAAALFLGWMYQQRWLNVAQARGRLRSAIANATFVLHSAKKIVELFGGSKATNPVVHPMFEAIRAEVPQVIRDVAVALETMRTVSYTSTAHARLVQANLRLLRAHTIILGSGEDAHMIEEAIKTIDGIRDDLMYLKFHVFPRFAGITFGRAATRNPTTESPQTPPD